jgi:uncharacterized protein
MSGKYNHNKVSRFHGCALLGLAVVAAQLVIPAGVAHAQEGMPGSQGKGSAWAHLLKKAPPGADTTLLPGEMLVYSPKKPVDMSSLVSFGPPEALGGEVLGGIPQLFGRIDFAQGNIMGGLFMATTGVIRVTFPFTEHATVLEGEVTITDATGQAHTYKPGDSYIIRQGSVVLWDVKGAYVVKSFFNVTEP